MHDKTNQRTEWTQEKTANAYQENGTMLSQMKPKPHWVASYDIWPEMDLAYFCNVEEKMPLQ